MFREEIVGDAAGRRKHAVTHKTLQNHGLAGLSEEVQGTPRKPGMAEGSRRLTLRITR